MIKDEYLRFLQTLITDDVSIDVRKIANLVLNNINTLAPLSTTKGLRIKKLVELSCENWGEIRSDIQPIKEQTEKQTCPFARLKSLNVGPFRGFAKQENFELDSNLVLIYGPNGTGKSSFCEALEYGLLGNVAEAESKRFRNQNEYLKNAYTNNYVPPILMGVDKGKNDIPIIADEVLYRFCFIEKNRIDNFSRIAAQAPAKQTELISTLFGLDAFSEFVRNFSTSMDNYIDLEGEKGKELNKKQQTLTGTKQKLENIPSEIKEIEDDEKSLANKYKNNCIFSQMVLELNGSEESKGLIEILQAAVEKPISAKSNLTVSRLLKLQKYVEELIPDILAKQHKLDETSRELSYKQLYAAVIQVKEKDTEKCPACQTPLSQVSANPFEYADKELKKLEYLGVLQEEIEKTDRDIKSSLVEILMMIKICISNFNENNVLKIYQEMDEENATIEWWNSLHQQLSDESKPWEHIVEQVEKLEKADKEIAEAIEKRNERSCELKTYRGIAEDIVRLQTRKDEESKAEIKAEKEIENFNVENAKLIADVEIEKGIIAQNKTIANAYAIFVQKLINYENSLPGQLVADLGETIVKLYNAFNRLDANHEQLAMVRLPLQQNQRLEISYKNAPDVFFDALHILSEGHIRCIGLAILAAKNIKENCRLLIFDDPVNAIDDDHREAIRRTMFEDDYFYDKQIILACHGEEFFKDIQNLLTAEKARQIKTFSFLPKIEDYNICVDKNCAPRNYVIAARAHFERNEIRDALDKSRRALESLTKNKVWSYVNRFGDGNLSIKLHSAKAPIVLRNLTEQLKKKIEDGSFLDTNKQTVLKPIESLLGINGDSREWRYLNKGTHEESDREEFNRQTVQEIISALEQLDAAIR